MTFRVTFRPEAHSDLRAIEQFIATDSPARAAAYVERIYDACMSLKEMPRRGRSREDLMPGLRILTFERRVVIAYCVEEKRVRIVNVYYGGRDYESLLRNQSRRTLEKGE